MAFFFFENHEHCALSALREHTAMWLCRKKEWKCLLGTERENWMSWLICTSSKWTIPLSASKQTANSFQIFHELSHINLSEKSRKNYPASCKHTFPYFFSFRGNCRNNIAFISGMLESVDLTHSPINIKILGIQVYVLLSFFHKRISGPRFFSFVGSWIDLHNVCIEYWGAILLFSFVKFLHCFLYNISMSPTVILQTVTKSIVLCLGSL